MYIMSKLGLERDYTTKYVEEFGHLSKNNTYVSSERT